MLPDTGNPTVYGRSRGPGRAGGENVLIDTTVAPNGLVAAEHLHPYHSERFVVISGEIEFRLGGEIVFARAGDVGMVEPARSALLLPGHLMI
jgi:quercetin dioxygenase-like cupin family protein